MRIRLLTGVIAAMALVATAGCNGGGGSTKSNDPAIRSVASGNYTGTFRFNPSLLPNGPINLRIDSNGTVVGTIRNTSYNQLIILRGTVNADNSFSGSVTGTGFVSPISGSFVRLPDGTIIGSFRNGADGTQGTSEFAVRPGTSTGGDDDNPPDPPDTGTGGNGGSGGNGGNGGSGGDDDLPPPPPG